MKQIGRFFSAFIAGAGKFAEAASVKEPDLKWVRESFAGGGMTGEVEIPMIMEAMKAELTLYNYDRDAMRSFGVYPGTPCAFQFRREMFDSRTGTSESVVIHLTATIDLEMPEWDRKKLEGIKLALFPTIYRRWQNGVDEYHIDPENGIFNFDGNPAFEGANRAIGRRY